MGLSPRLRGNRLALTGPGRSRRSIPALTGKPAAGVVGQRLPGVYPRAYGETGEHRFALVGSQGLSPRLRGNLAGRHEHVAYGGSIPALTGKPSSRRRGRRSEGVYPRAYGETNPPPPPPWAEKGSIPALTGKPRSSSRTVRSCGVYPRAYGETPRGTHTSPACPGLSPRLRGNQVLDALLASCYRSIPALTGKPAGSTSRQRSQKVYPRAYGETTPGTASSLNRSGLSPRLRGNPPVVPRYAPVERSIPALTGKPGGSI